MQICNGVADLHGKMMLNGRNTMQISNEVADLHGKSLD
jgi:hypothetical protein